MEELNKYERRKQEKEAERQAREGGKMMKKLAKYVVIVLVAGTAVWGISKSLQKPPEQVQLEEELKTVSLEGKVEEYEIEGRDHVPDGTETNYRTNPPTSGSHLSLAEEWGIYQEEISELAAVHSLEHGGIWISYKDVTEDERQQLEAIGRANPLSTLVSPRFGNDSKIAVVSWGRVMRLEQVDTALIQKYIETYKNDSPEKLAK